MTNYSVIFKRFEKIITDFDLHDLTASAKNEVELDLLKSAITKYQACNVDLSDRDDVLMVFNNTLTEVSEQTLAYYMAQAWAEPYMNNQDLFELNFASLEYNAFSSANKMKAIKDMASYSKKQAGLISTTKSVLDVMGGLK